MLQEKDRKVLFILALIAIALCLVVCVPFSLNKVSLFEIIVKYAVTPVYIAVVSIYGISLKFRNYRPANKFATIVTYTPLFSYAAALLFSCALNLVRGSDAYPSSSLTVMLIVVSCFLVAVICLSHLYYKAVITLSKNEAILIDALFAVLTIVFFVFTIKVANDLKNVTITATNKSVLFIVVPLVLGLATACLVAYSLKYLMDTNEEFTVASREELVQLWKDNKNMRSDVYDVAREDILNSMYDYTKEQLGIEEGTGVGSTSDEEVEALKQRINELELEVILAPLKKALEVLENEQNQADEAKAKVEEDYAQQIGELQAIVDEYDAKVAAEEEAKRQAEEEARLAAERRAQEALEREKNKKPIEPAFSEFVKVAESVAQGREKLVVKSNEKQTKVTLEGKTLLSVVQTKNDYKISVAATTEGMRSMLYTYNGNAVFERSATFPTSGAQLHLVKFSYKGDGSVDPEALKDLMKASEAAFDEVKAQEEEAIAEEKARKERANRAEKLLRKQELAEERAAQKAAEEEAKAAEEAAAQEAESQEAPAQEPAEGNNE